MKQVKWKGAAPKRPEFEIEAVFRRSFALLSAHRVTFFAIVAVASLLSPVLSLAGMPLVGPGLSTPHKVIGLALQIILWMFAQSVVTHAAFQELRGRRIDFARSFLQGGLRLVPALGAFATIFGVFVLVGGMTALPGGLLMRGLHIVPNPDQLRSLLRLLLIAAAAIVVVGSVMFWPGVPAAVIERPGFLGSIDRAMDLSRGYRWRVFGVGGFLMVIFTGAFIVGGILTMVAPEGPIQDFLAQVMPFVVDAAFSTLWAVVMTVVYHDLRVALEGFPDPDRDDVIAP